MILTENQLKKLIKTVLVNLITEKDAANPMSARSPGYTATGNTKWTQLESDCSEDEEEDGKKPLDEDDVDEGKKPGFSGVFYYPNDWRH